MSEIRERAQAWIKNETDSCWLFDCLGEEEGQQCVDAGYVIRDLLAELERVESERNDAMREASSLAKWLNKTYYAQDSPNWGLCDTPAGVITQIDNMITGIPEQARIQAARKCVEIAESNKIIGDDCDDDTDTHNNAIDGVIYSIRDHFGIKGE